MNDQPKFEEIRILGLETSEDEATPGRSVFENEEPNNELPPWTAPPESSTSIDDEWEDDGVFIDTWDKREMELVVMSKDKRGLIQWLVDVYGLDKKEAQRVVK